LRNPSFQRDGFRKGSTHPTRWVERKGEGVERARQAVHEIAASGLTLSKLAVAASMLGDLARGS
jgi:glutamate dehydrogenase